jgi:hypothetical protein
MCIVGTCRSPQFHNCLLNICHLQLWLRFSPPSQVVTALGKGLMSVLGISGSSSHKQREREREREREQARKQQQQREEEQRRRDAADRVAYLSARAGVSGTDAVRVAVHGRPVPEERGSYGPSAPFAVSVGWDGRQRY